jgi:hypothetical protein
MWYDEAENYVYCGILIAGALLCWSLYRQFVVASSCPVAAVWGLAATRLNAAASARGSPA